MPIYIVHTFALGPLFISLGSGFFGGVGLVDDVTFGGAGLGGAELFLNVGGSGLLGLKKDAKIIVVNVIPICMLTVQVTS